MKKSPLPFHLLTQWVPWLAAAALVSAHIIISVFWRKHDVYDDTGYMLAILRGVQGGGTLYREVFTQYGPFHAQAWLALLGIFSWPIDHNHAGLIVVLFWMGSAALVGWWGFSLTHSAWWAAGMSCWGAWSLAGLGAELAHPLSLAVFLTLLVLSAGVQSKGKGDIFRCALGGAALAALTFTKINLGIFAGAAVGLAFLTVWNRGRALSLVAALGSFLLPVVLVSKTWPEPVRAYLIISVCLTTLLAVRIWGSFHDDEEKRKSTLFAWIAGFAVAGCAILAVAMTQGATLTDLYTGMVKRPLQPSNFSQLIIPQATPWDHGAVACSLLLALAWQVPSIRSRKRLWYTAAAGAALMMLLRDPIEGMDWTVGTGALLWLALVAADGRSPAHRRAVLFGVLLAAWQGLGVFPVCGAQSTIPRIVVYGVWAVALFDALSFLAATVPKSWGRLSIHAARGIFWVALCCLIFNATGQCRRQLERNTAARLVGTEWFSFPRSQTPVLRGVVENLRQADGPVFTFHGQCSFPIWAGKPFVNGYNCTHITALLTPVELVDTFEKFREQPQWSALVLDGGRLFGEGPTFAEVDSFIRDHTVPWLELAGYTLRLSKGHPVPPPRHAVWRQNGVWHLSAPVAAMRKARKWQLQTTELIRGSGRWNRTGVEVVAGPDGYANLPVPPDMVASMENNPGYASISLCDTHWKPLAALPQVFLARGEPTVP